MRVESIEDKLSRVGEGEECGEYRKGPFLSDVEGHFHNIALTGDDPDCPLCYWGYVRPTAKEISKRLLDYWAFNKDKELVVCRVRPWKETVRRKIEDMYENRRTVYEAIEEIEGAYVFQNWLDEARNLNQGYRLIGFKGRDEELKAEGEWTIDWTNTFRFESFSPEGRAVLTLSMAREALEKMTYDSESTRAKFTSYGSLYGFDVEEEFAEAADQGYLIPINANERVKEASKTVFGTTPLDERTCEREDCNEDLIPVFQYREFVEDHWLQLEHQTRREIDGIGYVFMEPDIPPPGIQRQSKRFFDQIDQDTKPDEWMVLAQQIMESGLTQYERKRTLQEIHNLVRDDFGPDGIPLNIFKELAEAWG